MWQISPKSETITDSLIKHRETWVTARRWYCIWKIFGYLVFCEFLLGISRKHRKFPNFSRRWVSGHHIPQDKRYEQKTNRQELDGRRRPGGGQEASSSSLRCSPCSQQDLPWCRSLFPVRNLCLQLVFAQLVPTEWDLCVLSWLTPGVKCRIGSLYSVLFYFYWMFNSTFTFCLLLSILD